MQTASRGHRFAFIVLAVSVGLVAHTSAVPASTIPCVGDCAGDEQVTVDDVIKGVNIALGAAEVATCTAFDPAGDGLRDLGVLQAGGRMGFAVNICDTLAAGPGDRLHIGQSERISALLSISEIRYQPFQSP